MKHTQKIGPKLITASVILTLIIWIASKWYFQDWFSDPFKYGAKIASYTAVILMSWSLILSTRLQILENLFGGLDTVYQVHKKIGKYGFYIIFFHPLFLSLNRLPYVMNWIRFFGFQEAVSNYTISHNLGIFTLLLMIVLISLSLYIKIPYHVWKKSHEYFGLVYIMAIMHVVLVEANIVQYPILRFWMFGWFAAGLLSFLYIRLFYRFIGPRFDYTVESIEEVEDILEIWLKPKQKAMKFKPSQFIYMKTHNPNLPGELHPYSIACAPKDDGRIKLGIKKLGDFTKKLDNLNVNEAVTLYGPYGRFSEKFLLNQKDCVFIAGGIGITPFLGMWDTALNTPALKPENNNEDGDKPLKTPLVSLFYVCKNEYEASFDNDIKHVAICSQYAGYPPYQERGHFYEQYNSDSKGYISAQYISDKVGGLLNKHIFLCGPKPMTDALIPEMKRMGVKNSQISMEDFNLLGGKNPSVFKYPRRGKKKN
jgi:predicted ferric reductase